jgi:type IV pilus assembly protein PilE
MAQAQPDAGFTLIEVVIALAIVAITTTIAFASYRGHLERTHRSEAIQALLGVAAEQEKFYLANGRYSATLDAGPGDDPPGLRSASRTAHGRYRLIVEAADAVGYRAVAITARNLGNPQCHRIFIDESGRRGASDAVGADTSAHCW